MPVEYVKFAKLCAALYPQDSNWHRCQIIGVNKDANWAKVMFIDYGGDSNVPLRELKFLHHRFAELPVQAVTAHLFNVKEPTTPPKTTTASSNIIKRPSNGHHSRTSWWPSDMINYLLNRVTNKQFEAEVRGMSGDSLALDIYERDVDPENPNEDKWIWLNEQIVMDGYGEWFDETKDFSVS